MMHVLALTVSRFRRISPQLPSIQILCRGFLVARVQLRVAQDRALLLQGERLVVSNPPPGTIHLYLSWSEGLE